MNTQNAFGSNLNSAHQAARDTDATLRLLATLPAPDGLEKRVIAGLRSAPRTARVLNWRGALNPTENWLRSAAAAAIVFVVIGGGWGVYSRVQTASAIAAPPSTGAAGAFSNAGAVRVPQTVPAPVVVQPPQAQPVIAEPAKKARSKVARSPHRVTTPVAESKPAIQTSVPPVR